MLPGGQVISEEVGLKLDTAELDLLGRARKVVVQQDKTAIVRGCRADRNQSHRPGQPDPRRGIEKSNWTTTARGSRGGLRQAPPAAFAVSIKASAATEVELKDTTPHRGSACANPRRPSRRASSPGGDVALIQGARSHREARLHGVRRPGGTDFVRVAIEDPHARRSRSRSTPPGSVGGEGRRLDPGGA